MIRIQNLQKVFNRGKANQVIALHDINLDIKQGDFVVVIGANGSGKTTLLNTISGNSLPTSGVIRIGAENVTRLPEYSRSKWIARVFQNPLLGTASDLSIIDNFRLAALRTRSKGLKIGVTTKFRKSVQAKIETLNMGLESKLNQPMGTLSGGQRQALTLLMSVMDDVKIILLDEPAAALDPRSAEMVMQIAGRLIHEHQLTAILVTHNLKDAHQYGNRIIQMEEGKISRDMGEKEKRLLKQTDLYDWFM